MEDLHHRSVSEEISDASSDFVTLLSQKVVGQDSAIKFIVPYVYMWQAGLAPEGRPAGIFLLLGPTGTGKTRTVEAVAEVLHGSKKKILKVNCGEFQMEHETARLVGSPPGYLGHRETTPMLTQQQLAEVTSENCNLSIVLFDEVEKAAHSLTKLLLGILDKAELWLGDNTAVNFEKSLIFFTSNLGAREMMKEMTPHIGFQSATLRSRNDLTSKLETLALAAVKKRFSPEFVNRIDAVVTYQPLDSESLETILDHEITALQDHVNSRLGDRCFAIQLTPESRQFLLRNGVSQEYGARELKRTIHRQLTQPLATMVAHGQVQPGAQVTVSLAPNEESLLLYPLNVKTAVPGARPIILIADDNEDLLRFLASQLREEGRVMLTARTAQQARELFASRKPNTVLLDYILGDDDGLQLGLEFQSQAPKTHVIIMTGGCLSNEEMAVCEECDFPVLHKPFLPDDVLNLIRRRQRRARAAAGSSFVAGALKKPWV
jgi:CheY-like chemotaxis protein/ATP-dependent protease Clp ATPase subunit